MEFINRVPKSAFCILGNRFYLFLPINTYQRIISNSDNPTLWVAFHLTKCVKLLHMQIAQTGKFIKDTLGSIINTFVLFNNIAGKCKPILKRLFVTLNKQYLQFAGFKSKYYTVN